MLKSKKIRCVLSILFTLILLLNPCISSVSVYATSTEEIVQFNDSELETQLVYSYDINGDGKLSKAEMEGIYYLSLNEGENNIRDLTGLEYATNLYDLQIIDLWVTDFGVLKNLPSLQNLYISSRDLTDISSLEEVTNATSLNLYTENLQDITPLAKLTNLQSLDLYTDRVVDLSVLKSLNNLISLSLTSYTEYTDIDVLGELTNLESLSINLSNSYISDISSLASLENLKRLNIYGGISDENSMDTISQFTNLVELFIYTNSVNNLDKISNLTNLEQISLEIYGAYGASQFDIGILENLSKLVNIGIHSSTGDLEILNLNKLESFSGLYDLRLSNANINNIDFVKNSTTLTFLDLQNNKISDLTPLENLSNLSNLNLCNNEITDLTGIENLSNLQYLDVTGNKINPNEGNNATILQALEQKGVIVYIDEYDNSENVELDSNIKQYLIEYGYDYNADNEISTKELENVYDIILYDNYTVSTLKGLEYATNLQNLYIANISQELDFSVLKEITSLSEVSIIINDSTFDYSSIGELTQINNLSISKYVEEDIDLSFISNISNLTTLYLDGYFNIDFDDFNSLTKLRTLEIINNAYDIEVKGKLEIESLKNLILSYNGDVEFPMSTISNLSNLAGLEIDGLGSELIGLDKFSKLTGLKIRTNDEELNYSEMIKDLKIRKLEIRGKLKELDYLTTLTNLTDLILHDISYNPFDMETLQQLTNLENLSLTGNLSDISGLEKLEHIDYLELYNDEGLRPNDEKIVSEFDEEKFVETIEKIKTENLTIGGQFFSDLFYVNEGETLEIPYEDISPIIKAVMNPDSKLYNPDFGIYLNNYEEYPITVDSEKQVVNIEGNETGYKNCSMITSEWGNGTGFDGNIYLRWKVLMEANSTQEINIPDENLKNELLKKYDVDGDNKITQNDMVNISELELENKGIKDITGLEYATNMTYVNLADNEITDISPINGLSNLEDVIFTGNKIQDLTKIKDILTDGTFRFYLFKDNQITDLTGLEDVNFTWINLALNYLDFSEGSNDKEIVENSVTKYAKEEYRANLELAEYYGTEAKYVDEEIERVMASYMKQKYGTPEEREDVLEFEEALTNRLLELGVDINNDSKISKGELNDFNNQESINNLKYELEIDLSDLGITNIENLKYLSKVKILNLSNNNITDISPLKECKMLKDLDLSNNNISDITAIKDFYEIFKIKLSNNKISDISSLGEMRTINVTTISDDVFMGDGFGRDIIIDLSYNNIQDISPINKIRTLGKANLSHNKIRDINCLENYNFDVSEGSELLSKFEGIDLSYNRIDTTLETNKEAIDVFENKGVTLNLENQDLTTPILKGDVNGDGNITLADYTKILAQVKKTSELEGDALEAADVNGDGKVSLADYTKVLAHVKKTETLE